MINLYFDLPIKPVTQSDHHLGGSLGKVTLDQGEIRGGCKRPYTYLHSV